jgi:hypothetical protein
MAAAERPRNATSEGVIEDFILRLRKRRKGAALSSLDCPAEISANRELASAV